MKHLRQTRVALAIQRFAQHPERSGKSNCRLEKLRGGAFRQRKLEAKATERLEVQELLEPSSSL